MPCVMILKTLRKKRASTFEKEQTALRVDAGGAVVKNS
jgi:hypothetical protein